MNPIADDSLDTSARRWILVAAALAALFVAAIVLLSAHAAPAASDREPAQTVDYGL